MLRALLLSLPTITTSVTPLPHRNTLTEKMRNMDEGLGMPEAVERFGLPVARWDPGKKTSTAFVAYLVWPGSVIDLID